MLSKVLSKSTCAECRFCCSFRRCSLWETPLFPEEVAEKLKSDTIHFDKKEGGGKVYCQMNLEYKYKTQDPDEEAACEFLDSHKGCILSDEDKPFDCKIWPLRIMKKEEKLVIALTPTCPAINETGIDVMTRLVNDGLGQSIYDYAVKNPYIIKEYREGFPVLMEF